MAKTHKRRKYLGKAHGRIQDGGGIKWIPPLFYLNLGTADLVSVRYLSMLFKGKKQGVWRCLPERGSFRSFFVVVGGKAQGMDDFTTTF